MRGDDQRGAVRVSEKDTKTFEEIEVRFTGGPEFYVCQPEGAITELFNSDQVLKFTVVEPDCVTRWSVLKQHATAMMHRFRTVEVEPEPQQAVIEESVT